MRQEVSWGLIRGILRGWNWLYFYIASDFCFCFFRDVAEFDFARLLELRFGLAERFGIEKWVRPFFRDDVVVQMDGI